MPNYTVIHDRAALQTFIDWLPATLPGETFYVALLARNKYVRDLGIGTFNSDRHQCKRFLCTADRLMEKIAQLEIAEGAYRVKGIAVPQAALALYISPNPRDMVKGTKNSLIKFAELVANGSQSHNPVAEALSQVHKAQGSKHFVDVDFDGVTIAQTLPLIAQAVNLDAVDILQTLGGFHALVRVAAVQPGFVKSWWRKLTQLPGVDIKGDNLIPVPGCTQGGFVPSLAPASDWARRLGLHLGL